MTAESNYICHTFKVGPKYTCTLGWECRQPNTMMNRETGEMHRLNNGNRMLDCLWKPKTPKRYTKAMRRDYHAGRTKLMEMIAERTGQDFVAVEGGP